MPEKNNLFRAASRKRQKMDLQLPVPIDRYFEVPNEFARFLQKDSGKDDNERIPIIENKPMKNLLNLLKNWLVKGTFKLFFNSAIEFTQPILNLKVFHRPVYMHFPQIWLAVPMLPALEHVQPTHVKTSFELVIDEIPDVKERKRKRDRQRERERERERWREIEQFREGVTKKWMSLQITLKVLTKKTRLQIRSRPSRSKCETSTTQHERERVAQSTNNVKGWHYIMQMYFSGSTLKIWLPLQNLEEDSKV